MQICIQSGQEVFINNGKIVRTPMSTILKITKDERGKSVDQHEYRRMVGGLLYLTTKSSKHNLQ